MNNINKVIYDDDVDYLCCGVLHHHYYDYIFHTVKLIIITKTMIIRKKHAKKMKRVANMRTSAP